MSTSSASSGSRESTSRGGSGWPSGPSTDVEGEGELFMIYVLPETWGTSAGRGLMDAAKERLRAQYRDATLYVLDDNPRARRFYEREGWALDGVTKTGEFLGLPVAEVRCRIRL